VAVEVFRSNGEIRTENALDELLNLHSDVQPKPWLECLCQPRSISRSNPIPRVAAAGREFQEPAFLSTDHPGIVFCRRTLLTQGQIIRFLILLHGAYTPAEMKRRVEYPF